MKLPESVRRGLLVAALAATVLGLVSAGFLLKDAPMSGVAVPSGTAVVEADDQKDVMDVIQARRVLAPGDAWLVVQLEGKDGRPGMVVGKLALLPGETFAAAVPLDAMGELTERLFVTLYADSGTRREFEVDMEDMATSRDKPFVVGGRPVQVTIDVTQYGIHVAKEDASLSGVTRAGPDAVTVGSVVTPEPAWLVVHEWGADGLAGRIVGTLTVSPGRSAALRIPLVAAAAESTLSVVLHGDRGSRGVLDLDMGDMVGSADQEVFAGGMEVSAEVRGIR